VTPVRQRFAQNTVYAHFHFHGTRRKYSRIVETDIKTTTTIEWLCSVYIEKLLFWRLCRGRISVCPQCCLL